MPSPNQHVTNLVVSLPIRRDAGAFMKVLVLNIVYFQQLNFLCGTPYYSNTIIIIILM